MLTMLVTVEVVIFLVFAAYMVAFALSFSPVNLADLISRTRTTVLNSSIRAMRLYQRFG